MSYVIRAHSTITLFDTDFYRQRQKFELDLNECHPSTSDNNIGIQFTSFFKKNSPNLIVIFGDLSSKHRDKYYLCCMLCWFGTKRCSQVRQVFTNSAAVNMISKPQGKARENNDV